jgi:uncharacterized membrane protein YjjP (DUF1212 family)
VPFDSLARITVPPGSGSSRRLSVPGEKLSPDAFADYLLELGGTLVGYGCPSYRVEEVIGTVARHEGYDAQAFAIPTGLFLSIHSKNLEKPVVRMARLKGWGTHLERLVLVDAIFNDVAARRCTIQDALKRLDELEGRRDPYPRWVYWVAAAVASGAAAVAFRGGPLEVSMAGLAGLLIAVLGSALSTNESGRYLVDFLGPLVAATVAWGAARANPTMSREVVVLAGVITLVPGMTLTTGLAEIARKNLVAGGARLMEALGTFLLMLFGIALAVGVEKMTGAKPPPVSPRVGLGLFAQGSAIVAAALAFAVLFSMPRRYAWAAVISAGIGGATSIIASRYLPSHVVAFASALGVCVFSNLCARMMDRPAQLFQLPGIVLLVPGSFGFLSLESFLRGEFLNGAAKGFDMLLVSGALVTGVLVANMVMPAKKLL